MKHNYLLIIPNATLNEPFKKNGIMPMLKILDSASLRSSGSYIFAIGIIALLMGICLLSCSDDEINGTPGEEKNYMKVENTTLENIGLITSLCSNFSL